MKISGTQDELWQQLATPGLAADLASTEHVRGKMEPYQYAAVYTLARRYDGGHILEIGGFKGRGTLILSLAAPKASIITLEPYYFEETSKAAAGCKNVTVIKDYSFRYLRKSRTAWDMVLVDGNHKRIKQDLPWFNRLKVGGLILFHDYTPADAVRSRCPHVYAAVNDMGKSLGREPDVIVVDAEKIGMAGFFRRKREGFGGRGRGRHR